MSSSPSSVPPSPGTPEYIPSLLARVRSAHPTLPLDPVVLQTLLLCLIARRTDFGKDHNVQGCTEHAGQDGGCEKMSGRTCFNLILRTREEDIGLLQQIVSLILTTAFGIPTHKHKFSPQHKPKLCTKSRVKPVQAAHPNALLRALFFRRPSTPQRAERVSNGSKSSSTHMQPQRRSGVPSPSPLRISAVLEPERAETDADRLDYFLDNASMASSRRPPYLFSTPGSTMRSPGSLRPGPDGLRTDPLSLTALFAPLQIAEGSSPDSVTAADTDTVRGLLPKAVVVSGLERAGVPLQRALLHVLAEQRLILENDEEDGHPCGWQEEGTWNLPDNFLMVYVCAWDAHERPDVLPALLDRFALSADVALAQPTRNAHAALRTTPSPLSAPSPLSTPPAISARELAHLRACTARNTAMRAPLHLYLRDLFAAARHHPALGGAALTRRAHADAAALARALRVLGGDEGGTALVRVVAAERGEDASMGESVSASGAGSEWEKDALGTGWAEELGGQGGKWEGGVREVPEGAVWLDFDVRASDGGGGVARALGLDEDGRVEDPGGSVPLEAWDVSEVDVARVFPRVVSHRVRVRDGPEDEVLASVMWPAVSPPHAPAEGGVWERMTVKEILVEILADV